MSEELRISPGLVASVRRELSQGRQVIEDSAAAAPETIDAGDLSAMLLGMMARVADSAAAASEALAAIGAQVQEVDATFWEVDSDAAVRHGGRALDAH